MSDTNSSLMARLRDATWPQHQHAESRPLEQGLAKGTLPKDGYIALLEQRLPVHITLEKAWVMSGQEDPRIAQLVSDELLQVDNLRADLNFFERDIDRIEPLSSTRALIEDLEQALNELPHSLLGHYYVFEGSKNGGHMLAKGLRHVYDLPQHDGTRYFDPHGQQQRSLWMSFKARVDLIDFSDAERDQIVEAAKRTFDHVSAMDDELYAQVAASTE